MSRAAEFTQAADFGGGEALVAGDAFAQEHAYAGGDGDDLDVAGVEQGGGRAVLDENAVAQEAAAEAGNQGEEKHADDVVATADGRERAGEREGGGGRAGARRAMDEPHRQECLCHAQAPTSSRRR